MLEGSASNAVPGWPGAHRGPKPPNRPDAPEPPGGNAPTPPNPPAPPEAPEPPAPQEPLTDDARNGRARNWLVKSPEHRTISDPTMMRALSHPARMIVFDLLGSKKSTGEDGATATEIAKAAGMTPSAMSYHLRTLAKAGFIEEAPSRGDARERVWRLAISEFSIESEPDAPESHHLAEAAMFEAFMEAQDRRTRRWHQVRRELDPDSELYRAQTFSQGGGLLTPEEAGEFIRRLYEVIEDYVELSRKRSNGEAAVPEGAERYEYILRVFPDL